MMSMEEEKIDFTRDTLGHEADRLLRTVTRVFLSDIFVDGVALGDSCSIVLDIILRNHYQTRADEICHACSEVPKRKIQTALNVLVQQRILSSERRVHFSVYTKEYIRANAPKENNRKKRNGFVPFDFRYQRQQKSQEMVREEIIQSKERLFYYVDYHSAVEVIRFRLWKLLRTDEVLQTVYKCDNCGKEYCSNDFDQMMDDDCLHHTCTECMAGDVKEISPEGKEVARDKFQRNQFRRVLDPIIKLINVVMKKTFIPFDKFSSEENKLREEMRKMKEKDSNPSVDPSNVVDIEEDFSGCPGAMDKSLRDHNRVIPWFVHHGFFSPLSDEEVDCCSPPNPKHPRISEDAIPPSQEFVEDKEVTKKIRRFDRDLQRMLARTSEDDLVCDTASIRSESVCSGDDQDAISEMEDMPQEPISVPPKQKEQKVIQEQTDFLKVCLGFDEDLLGDQVVCVGGVLRPIVDVSVSDMNGMNDEEYMAFANIVARIAGVC